MRAGPLLVSERQCLGEKGVVCVCVCVCGGGGGVMGEVNSLEKTGSLLITFVIVSSISIVKPAAYARTHTHTQY